MGAREVAQVRALIALAEDSGSVVSSYMTVTLVPGDPKPSSDL